MEPGKNKRTANGEFKHSTKIRTSIPVTDENQFSPSVSDFVSRDKHLLDKMVVPDEEFVGPYERDYEEPPRRKKTTVDKRVHQRLTERQRRAEENKAYEELKLFLPGMQGGGRMSKVTILKQATELIIEYRRRRASKRFSRRKIDKIKGEIEKHE